MREMKERFALRATSFGFEDYVETKVSLPMPVASCPRTRASRLIRREQNLDFRPSIVLRTCFRGNDDSARTYFLIEFPKQAVGFGLNSKPETRNPKQGGFLWP